MELSNHLLSLQIQNSLFHHPLFTFTRTLQKPRLRLITLSLANSSPSSSSQLAQTLQAETLKTLEWSCLCKQLSPFTSTSMGLSVTETAKIPIGETREETQRILHQTTAALAALEEMESGSLHLSHVEDVSRIVDSATSRELLTIKELCSVEKTLRAARGLWEKLEEASRLDGDCAERYSFVVDTFWERGIVDMIMMDSHVSVTA